MTSLSAHLRRPEAHAELPFHAGCPVCRDERLLGTLTSRGLVSPRTQAALAASLLALTATTPAALAAEQDSEHQGTAPPSQTSPTDTSQSAEFDPGGSGIELPAQAPTPPEAQPPTPGNNETGRIEPPSTTNTDAPIVDNGDGSQAPSGQTTPTAAVPSPPQSSSEPGATADSSPPTTPAQPAASSPPSVAPATAPAVSPRPAQHTTQTTPHEHRASAHHPTMVHQGQPASSSTQLSAKPQPATVTSPAAATAASTPAAARTPSADDARLGDRAHTVHAGESLWSIASDILGFSASPARIAREVHRLWRLNRDQIGTGSPDLLMTGTTLRLR